MAFALAERIRETTSTIGTGTLNLGGPVVQWRSFVSGIGSGNTTSYCITSGDNANWEVGIGTVTSGSPDTLSRDTVIASSNAGARINLSGVSTVFCTQVADTGVIPGSYAAANITVGPDGRLTSAANGGSAGSPPTVRGSGIQTANASSFTVNWPAGTVAGDLALIFYGHAFTMGAPPAGWTLLDASAGSNSNGAVLAKVLTSGDITAGHVVLTASGSFNGTMAIVTFVGATTLLAGVASRQNGSGATAAAVSSGTYVPNASGVYFSFTRAGATCTCNQGSILQQSNDGSAASAGLFFGAPGGAPFIGTANFSFSSAGSGYYIVELFVLGP